MFCRLDLSDPAIVKELQRLQAGGFEEDSDTEGAGAGTVGKATSTAAKRNDWQVKAIIWTVVGVFLVWRLYSVLSRELPAPGFRRDEFDDL